MSFEGIFTLFLSSVLINNFVWARFLGICPFIGVTRKLDEAIGMGFAVIFVMVGAGVFSWLIFFFLLDPITNMFGLDLIFLKTILFILVIASFVQLVEMYLKKFNEKLFKQLGIYLPLITTNCAILGMAELSVIEKYNFLETIIFSFSSGVGFTLAMVIMASIREELEAANIPVALRGAGITLLTAGLLALAFSGFSGMI
jgi:Na+-translocating ferredoxin:NAD+ oxidoreductase subunit A